MEKNWGDTPSATLISTFILKGSVPHNGGVPFPHNHVPSYKLSMSIHWGI